MALIRMRSALDVWMTETSDRGEFPEPGSVIDSARKEMHEWFGTPAWAGHAVP
jgi:hypothetical protein